MKRKSMLPTMHLKNSVVECLALLLNDIAHTEKGDVSLLFFGLKHMKNILQMLEAESQNGAEMNQLVGIWDEFIEKNTIPCDLNADLVFISIQIRSHYFCVCVNFKAKKIEVLDNQSHEKWETCEVYKVAKLVANVLSDYLEGKNNRFAADVPNFPVVNVAFKWQKKEAIDEESGLFLLMHMICYEGELYESNIGSKVARREYCAELAAAMMLADMNDLRETLLVNLKQFQVKKKIIAPYVESKRSGLKKFHAAEAKKQKQVAEAEKQEQAAATLATEIPVLRQTKGKKNKAVN